MLDKTPVWQKVCQRHFSFDVSMHKSDSDAHSLTCCFETVMKNKEKKRENEEEKKDDDDKGIYVYKKEKVEKIMRFKR